MDSIQAKGTITIYEGKKEKVLNVFPNLVLDISLQGLINQWGGVSVGYGKIDYLVIGDGNAAVNGNNSTLSNETFRKPITDLIISSKKIVVDTFITTDEANFLWKEIGLVSGGDWGTTDSGILLNRALINEEKNSLKSKTVSWEISIN